MAKIVGIVGGLRGKSGNVVFSKGDNGTTIMRPYQPKVKNPRTDAQMLQRSKMNAVGQFSALCPAELLAPLRRGTARMNRSYFAKTLLNAAMATKGEGGIFTSSFDPEVVKFSKGSEVLRTTMGNITMTAEKITIALDGSGIPAELIGEYGERIVLGVIDDLNNAQFDSISFVDHLYDSTAAADEVFPFGRELTDGQTLVVWRIPFVLDSTRRGANAQDIYITEGNDISARILTATNTIAARWGDTFLETVTPFVAA